MSIIKVTEFDVDKAGSVSSIPSLSDEFDDVRNELQYTLDLSALVHRLVGKTMKALVNNDETYAQFRVKDTKVNLEIKVCDPDDSLAVATINLDLQALVEEEIGMLDVGDEAHHKVIEAVSTKFRELADSLDAELASVRQGSNDNDE